MNIKDFLKDSPQNIIILLIVVFIFFEVFTLFSNKTEGNFNFFRDINLGKKSFEQYADETIEKCKNVEWRPGCYDEEIPKLMDHISFEDAFEVTKIIQTKENGYWYCHVLGHNLSARETAKDPSKWMDVVARSPSGICSNGSIHGAFQERFREEVLTNAQIDLILPDLKSVCEPRTNFNPTGLEQASCYHALGHLTMYMSGADVNKSLQTCDTITKNFKQMCYDGVFMQIYQPLEPEDFALVAGIAPKDKKESLNFCGKFRDDDFTYSTCLRESWPLWRVEIKTAQGILDFCNMAPTEANKNRCFNAIFYVNVPQLGFNLEKILAICTDLPKDVKGKCFANSASRLIETDYKLYKSSVSLCNEAQKQGVGEACYKELSFYATFNYHKGSEESRVLCRALPKSWQESCLNGGVQLLEN